MYINSLEIKNLRCFRETKIELQHPDGNKKLRFPNINILLGDNGSGKSSILKAIALATLYPVLQKNSGLVLYRMVRDMGKNDEFSEDAFLNAEISLHLQDLGSSKESELSIINLMSIIRRSGDVENLLEYHQRSSSNKIFNSSKKSIKQKNSLLNNLKDNPSNLHPLVELSRIYQQQTKWEEAEEVLFELLKIDSHNLPARIELSKIYRAQKKWEAAEHILLETLEIDSYNLRGRIELSMTYRAQKKWEKAEQFLLETLEIDSHNLPAHIELSIVYRAQKRWEAAEHILLETLEVDFRNLPARIELSIIYREQNRWNEAEHILLEALKIAPRNLPVRNELSIIYRTQNRIDLAEEILLKSTEKVSMRNFINEMFEDHSPAFLVVGYGVTRRIEDTINYNFKEQSRNRLLRYSRVASLFESSYGLIHLQSWLPEMELTNRGRYTQVVHLIDRLTPEDMKFDGELMNDEFYFDFRGAKIPFGALSDGYRHFIGWIADMLYHICMAHLVVRNWLKIKG